MCKGHFHRTNQNHFVAQLALIERHEVRLQCIHACRMEINKRDPTPDDQQQHYVIGHSQNFPEDLTQFVQKNSEDVTVMVSTLFNLKSMIESFHCQGFVQKLKLHLWPWLCEIHGHSTPPSSFETEDLPTNVILPTLSNVAFKNN